MLREKLKRKLVKNEGKARSCDDSSHFKHQLRFTKSKPSISFSENPRAYYIHSRAKKKSKRVNPAKVKIFLEFPDEIYKFETGCNDEDDSDKKIHEIAKDQVETESFKISEDLEDKSMTMEEESVLITPNKIGEDSIKSTPQKNKTKLSPLTSSHTPPPSSRQFPNQQTLLELALVQRTPPSVGRHDSSNFNGDRKFSIYENPPKPRQLPSSFKLLEAPETLIRTCFDDYDSLEHHKRFRSPKGHRQALNKHSRHSPSPHYDYRRYDRRNKSDNSKYLKRSESRHENMRSTTKSFRKLTPHKRSKSISNGSLIQVSPVSREKTRSNSQTRKNEEPEKSAEILTRRQETSWKNLRSQRTSIEEQKPGSTEVSKNKSDIISNQIMKSPTFLKLSLDQSYESKSCPEKLAILKKKQRKIERDLKRAQKELRKMKLRKMIKELEGANENYAGLQHQAYQCSNDYQLQKLQNFNVFEIGKNPLIASNNQLIECCEIVPKQKIRRLKQKSEKFKSLPTPSPPKGDPPSHLYQPTRRNLFLALPVDLEPMIQKTIENMNSLRVCWN